MESTIGKMSWYKSSYSGNGGGSCVEVSTSLPGVIALRDSKNPDGPALVVEPEAFATFTAAIKNGELTH